MGEGLQLNQAATPGEQDSTGRLRYELGNGQWDIPELHILLEEILPEHNSFDGYEY